ncbi:MAG: FtsW/RodA/SpoVE family cell cycle protein [Clostridia bacterium]|nr:FtsW/RodA/SpoVE family cell cycle protein [Clostridia bacterium]
MNIALKAQKGKNKNRGANAVTGTVMLFAFCGFLLLMLQKPSLLTGIMLFSVPLAIWLTDRLLPRLFPMDRLLLSLINFLCALGVLMQYRFSPARGLNQCLNYGAGLIAMTGCALAVRAVKNWKLLIPPMIAACCGLLALPFIFRGGSAGLGATAWVAFGSFRMQPSEIVKIAYVFVLAWFLCRRRVVLALVYTGAMLAFLVAQRDLGTAAIYGGTMLVMLYAATSSLFLILGILGVGVGAVSVLYVLFRDSFFLTVQNRIKNWLDPFATYDQLGGGYQMVHALIAMANGGWWGTGLGLGNANTVPEYATDFIFSTVMNEFGLVFSLLVLGVYALIVLRAADIALRSTSAFHALLALGGAALLAVQTFIIIGGITKMIPMTGVTVPFLSYGGTSLVSCMGIMGVVQGVASRNERILREDRELAEGGGEDRP